VKAQARASSISSPFSPVLGAYTGHLPPVFEEQFLLPAGSSRAVHLIGKMERIWHRPAWLWPFLWLLAQADVIFPETGTGTDASLSVTAGRDSHGQPYLRWERIFRFKTQRHFNATMFYDRRLKRVVERMGPSGLLNMVWDVRFSPPDTIRISTAGCVVRAGRRRLWLPRLLCVDVTAVERALESGEGIHILVTVAHPLLGSIFGYSGVFHLQPHCPPPQNMHGR
jgi:Domain of unknown function (DUF4166)